MKTLNWEKVKSFVKERKPKSLDAGLLDDWYFTADTVYSDGKWIEEHNAYTCSNWATPGFKAEMDNGDRVEVVASREMTEDDKISHEKNRKKISDDIKKIADFIESRK